MNTLDINKSLEKITWVKGYYCGTLPFNYLPQKIEKPCFFILNTHDSRLPGEHWIVLHFSANNSCYYFDSFGEPLQNKFIINIVNKNCKKFYYNKKKLQDLYSSKCGEYCVMFVAFIGRGYDYEDFLNLFSNNHFYNDMLIEHLFEKIFINKK
jgi:hypothetical protein